MPSEHIYVKPIGDNYFSKISDCMDVIFDKHDTRLSETYLQYVTLKLDIWLNTNTDKYNK